ncbi:VOC family protein [Phenylobacterium immobile]|uniref:VOC family protein n=1 Tax=Phenylobacterium immobile TaxID=21 RepID=UPI000AF51E54|nr:VOC family protein [Phenylobacterium immobile]
MTETFDFGSPPKGGWAKLAPELLVSDLAVSRAFWIDVLGFGQAYQRPGFVYLERPEGGQIMLCDRSAKWETAELVPPFGRGVIIQVFVGDIEPELQRLSARAHPLYAQPREVWRRTGDRESGKREFVVQDPDGYLVLMAADLGERSPS